ncbi:MAG TPA: hypothetical protein VF678_02910 [bacterium]
MKRIALLSLAVLASLAVANSAFALSFSVDVPLQFTLDSKFTDTNKTVKAKDVTSNKADGFILGASAGWFGLGYEKYDVDLKAVSPGGNFPFTLTYQFYDVFVNLPFPAIRPVLGYGKGTLNLDTDSTTLANAHIKPADATQVFASIGFPVGPLFDLHVGYHKVNVEDAEFSNSPGNKLKSSGSLWTLGARLGW